MSLSLRGLVTTGSDRARRTESPSSEGRWFVLHHTAEILRHASLVVTRGGRGPLVQAFAAGVRVTGHGSRVTE
ncbi:hypothetical protein [Parafrankia elaeagni]|uniref:hypothetical protein n=1 Tax=Parafrankia elaeagni TaxID=222534 RepID=UPI000382045D|nr:hypothetical protein [Parafrankia elaeagni]